MATTSFIINEFTGSDAQVRVTLTDIGDGVVQVKLEVVSGYIADTVGFFANFGGLTVNNNFTITPVSPELTVGTQTEAGSLYLDDSGSTIDGNGDLDSNVNLSGGGTVADYDLGVQIGVGGIGGGDDYPSVTFNLSAEGLDVSDFSEVGVRLQSVGEDREGSSKLTGDVPSGTPSIDVEKYVSIDGGLTWVDADTLTGPSLLESGADPLFKFVVTNTGTVDLSNVALTDSDFGLDGLTGDLTSGNGQYDIGTLAVGASTELIFSGATWQAGQHTNTATATGSSGATTVSDTDNANYFGADTSIQVKKYVSIDGGVTWVDADTGTGPSLLESGAEPQFKFVVTNTGNVDLSNVVLTDSDFNLDGLAGDATLGNSQYNISTLAVGASTEVIFTGATWQVGQHTNTATTTSSYTDDAGNTESNTDTDDANYFGADTSIQVKKYVSIDGGATWVDADTGTGPSLLEIGADPQFKFVVTNTGNVALSNIVLTDSDFNLDGLAGDATLGNSQYNISSLAAGASTEVIFTGAAWQVGQHTNTGTTTGSFTDDAGNTDNLSDTDDANYLGANASIDVEKWISFDGGATWLDADTADTGLSVLSGNDPQFKFVVTNTGNVDLSNVTLSDSIFNLDGWTGDATLGNGLYDISSLAAGASTEVIFTGAVWQVGQHTNTASTTVSYTDDAGNTVSDTDTDNANYFGVNPNIDLEKYVSVDGGKTWVDADTATGPLARDTEYGGVDPQFKFVVKNTGNVDLSNIVLGDDTFDLNGDLEGNTITIDSLAANDGIDGGLDEFVFIFNTAVWEQGQHTNIGDISTSYTDDLNNTANLSDTDAANYYGAGGPGVGTPGFWKQWAAVWDGNTSNDWTFNTRTNFAKADILYAVDDPVTTTTDQVMGLLVGDFNLNGTTDAGESTIFYTVSEARAILDATKTMEGQDARYIMGKQLVASWLNVMAGNEFIHVQDDINSAIQWMQAHSPDENGDGTGDGSLTLAASQFRVASSSGAWSGSGSGVLIKNALDTYNNTGAGLAIDRDTGTYDAAALAAYQESLI